MKNLPDVRHEKGIKANKNMTQNTKKNLMLNIQNNFLNKLSLFENLQHFCSANSNNF